MLNKTICEVNIYFFKPEYEWLEFSFNPDFSTLQPIPKNETFFLENDENIMMVLFDKYKNIGYFTIEKNEKLPFKIVKGKQNNARIKQKD